MANWTSPANALRRITSRSCSATEFPISAGEQRWSALTNAVLPRNPLATITTTPTATVEDRRLVDYVWECGLEDQVRNSPKSLMSTSRYTCDQSLPEGF